MELYNPNAICIKCGHNDIFSQYVSHGDYDCHRFVCPLQEQNGEHIHRGCRRCSYKWPEMVLNLAQRPLVNAADDVPLANTPDSNRDQSKGNLDETDRLASEPVQPISVNPKTPVSAALDEFLPEGDALYEKYRAAQTLEDREKFYSLWASTKVSDRKAV